MYKNIAKNTALNGALKQLFSEFDTIGDYQLLTEQIYSIRQLLNAYQDDIIKQFRMSDFSLLPIYLIKDKASSSGGTFLRWRSALNGATGDSVWTTIVADDQQSAEIRQLLAAAEKNRILINMQVSVLNFMLRQLNDCTKKVKSVDETLHSSLFVTPEKPCL
ncbi:DUF3158 family protein [Pasteurella testudinis]|uniref:DUF3158 family protein n=1 Tax=Pasteurella testudinis TaxID=761 RepID=UPI0040587768